MNQVTPERTGWRDEGISRRHRLWGVTCKATDIDFLLLEYHLQLNLVKVDALIEYKRKKPPRELSKTLQVTALAALGNRASIPTFVVYYSCDFKNFDVFASNNWGYVRLGEQLHASMTEESYVTFLYKLRNVAVVPQNVWEDIEQADSQQAPTITHIEEKPSLVKFGQISLFD